MADQTDAQVKNLDASRKKLIRQRGEIINWMTEIESELDDIIIIVFVKPEFERVFLNALLWEDFRLSTKIRLFEAIPFTGEGKKFQNEVVKHLRKLASIRNKFAHRLSMINSEGTFLIDRGHQEFPVTDERMEEFRQEARFTLAALKAVIASLTKHEPESIQKGELTLISVEQLTQAIKAKLKNAPDQLLFSTRQADSHD